MSTLLAAATLDERLRLFAFATEPNRVLYLWVLRAFDRARQRYRTQLHAEDVGALLHELAEETAGVPEAANLPGSLDALVGWGVLARTQDGARAASIAEYRRRSSVYQLTELGHLAHSAVEAVLGARPDEAELRRLVFAELLDELGGLSRANAEGNAEQVNIRLDRIHRTLEDLARRAGRFYLAVGELARTHDADPQSFLLHKDRLLAHLEEFLSELQRYRPLLVRAVEVVEGTGVEALVAAATRADSTVFGDPEARVRRWQARWDGVVGWFRGTAAGPAQADLLDRQTTSAIRDLSALLRRVTERRRGGVSRETELRLLARWLFLAPDGGAVHALANAAFGLSAPRRLGIAETDPDLVPPGKSWWQAPPVAVSMTLREHGKTPSPGRPAPIREDFAARRRGREDIRARHTASAEANAALRAMGALERELDAAQFVVLRRLLDRALRARAPVSGVVRAEVGEAGTRLRLTHGPMDTVVHAPGGRLLLRGLLLEILPA